LKAGTRGHGTSLVVDILRGYQLPALPFAEFSKLGQLIHCLLFVAGRDAIHSKAAMIGFVRGA
jgi:hypothetical protein